MSLIPPPLFARSESDRLVAGVAGGLGARIGVEPVVLRMAIVVLAFAGGVGIVAYLLMWLLSGEGDAPPTTEPGMRRMLAVWIIVAGVLALLREFAMFWPGDAMMLSAGLGGFGSAVLWTRSEERERLSRFASRIPVAPAEALAGLSRGKVAIGGVLVLAGMITFLSANTSVETVRNVVFAVAVTAGGLSLILAPWIARLVRSLRAERHERIRSEERAEVAAHLHDSVLQTFALIQRSGSSQEMASLARAQERELRSWLYGRSVPGAPTMLSDALEDMAARIERLHRVAVESVLVGDAEIDDRLRALVDAAGEAVTNAAKHAGVTTISMYCEVTEAEVSLYVRDEGGGFEVATAAVDRRGITESIVGRMERNGGVATIRSRPAEGTEVHLRLPRNGS